MNATDAEERDLETLFELLVRSVEDYGIILLDCDGNVRSWNAGAERCKGYRAEEIIGRHVSCFYPRKDVEEGRPHRELEVAASRGRYEEESWRVRKDGSHFWASVSITALVDKTGKLAGFGKVVRDLTGRLRTNEQFRLAIEASPTGMILVDSRGEIVLVNAEVEKLFGYTRQEVVGQHLEMLVPHRFRAHHAQLRAAFLADPQARAMGAGRELFGLRKDETEVPIEIGLNPLRTSEGEFILSSIVDVTERKRAEREREQLLRQLTELNVALEQRVRDRTAALTVTLQEREVLLQEVHHRVKNNLYVIVSLMEMQARVLQQSEGCRALEDCQGRVHAIALIHEKLYQSSNYADVPFAGYLRSLTDEILHAAGVSPSHVSLLLEVDDVAMTVEKAIPCGLVVNELMTNALKHAFPGGRRGTIRVALETLAGGQLRLVVADDGVGLPPGSDFRATKSLGLRLVVTLAEQLGGELAVRVDSGTRVELVFPGTAS